MTQISYSVDVDDSSVRDALSLFEFLGGNSDEALRVAINRTGKKVLSGSSMPGGSVSRRIRDQIRVKAKYLSEKDGRGKPRLSFDRATRRSLAGRITTQSRGILLSRFSTDANLSGKTSWLKPPPLPKRGPRVKVKPKGATQQVRGRPGEVSGKPFYMVLKNSRALAIVARRSDRGIKVFYGPSVSQVFNTVRDDVLPQASATYQSELLDAIRFLLAKRYPKE